MQHLYNTMVKIPDYKSVGLLSNPGLVGWHVVHTASCLFFLLEFLPRTHPSVNEYLGKCEEGKLWYPRCSSGPVSCSGVSPNRGSKGQTGQRYHCCQADIMCALNFKENSELENK